MSEVIKNNSKLDKSIVIYLHMPFDLKNGGVTVQYYLASVLYSYGIDIKICNVYDNNKHNNIYNNFITIEEFKLSNSVDNTIVIYSEGVIGNPLYAKFVVRWLLSKLGQNVPIHYYQTWDPNELIYFFNTENELIDKNIDYKQLSLFYIAPFLKDLHRERKGDCFTKRKQIIQNPQDIHSNSAFEVTRNHTQENYLEIFNTYERFISYDPISFLTIIAAICGCISIVCPINNLSKKDYFKMTALYDYMVDKNIDSIYGIAYGNTPSEIEYSKNTLPFVNEQINDIKNWFIDKYVKQFIYDIINWQSNKNTLLNYINSINLTSSFIGNFDVKYYRKMYIDIRYLSDSELIDHYINQGKKQGRLCSENILDNTNNKISSNIDLRFYRNYYKDLRHMTNYVLIEHYKNFGIKEGRFINKKQFEYFISNK